MLAAQERSHARLLQAISSISNIGIEGGAIANIEGRHRTAVKWFRIVFDWCRNHFVDWAECSLLWNSSGYFGFATAGITFGIGKLIGVSIGG